LLRQADAEGHLQGPVDQRADHESVQNRRARNGALGGKRNAPLASENFDPKDPNGQSAPRTAEPVQRPDTQHVADLHPLGNHVEADDEDRPGDGADHRSGNRAVQIAAGTDGRQTRQGPVVSKSGVIPTQQHTDEDPADHGHQTTCRNRFGTQQPCRINVHFAITLSHTDALSQK
jgi:hypothetical protein